MLLKFKHIKSLSLRDNNSIFFTDYDNGGSDDFYSDSELLYNNNSNFNYNKMIQQKENIKQNVNNKNNLTCKLRQAFSGVDLSYKSNSFLLKQNKKSEIIQKQISIVASNLKMRQFKFSGSAISNGKVSIQAYEGDIDSNCSSIASSQMFLNSNKNVLTHINKADLINCSKWKSVYSIGYDNEYEFASESEYCYNSDYDKLATDSETKKIKQNEFLKILSNSCEIFDSSKLPAFKSDFKSFALDKTINDNNNKISKIINTKFQVQDLSRDICQNYGEYKLASFSSIEA